MRLIDADALIHMLCCHCTEYEICLHRDGSCDDFDMVAITHAPTIDPVKHGKCVSWKYGKYICSLCNEQIHQKFNYCPNCGAKMDGDE